MLVSLRRECHDLFRFSGLLVILSGYQIMCGLSMFENFMLFSFGVYLGDCLFDLGGCGMWWLLWVVIPVAVVYVAGLVFFVLVVFVPAWKYEESFIGRLRNAGVVLCWPVFLFVLMRGMSRMT